MSKSSCVKRVMHIGDVHFPFHDKRHYALACKVASVFRPDHAIFAGDVCDCHSISDFDKAPERVRFLADELATTERGLDVFAQCAGKQCVKFVTEGNHEHRLMRLIRKNHALHGLKGMSVAEQVGYRRLGYGWCDYGKSYKLGDVSFTHAVGSTSLAFTQSTAKYGSNVLFGHTHSAGTFYRGTVNGTKNVGMSSGWLGDPDAADYASEEAKAMWQHGVTVGYLLPNGHGIFHFIPFLAGEAVLEGQVIMVSPKDIERYGVLQ